jgi:hypothetical protein
LIAAFVVTAATSKSGDYGQGAQGNHNGVSNYAVQSNCPARPDIFGIRTQHGLITQSVGSDGTLNTNPTLDFTQFGFPQRQIVVGLDQVGNGAAINRNCIVRTKYSRRNTTYDPTHTSNWFILPGYLTSIVYDCFESNSFICSTTLSELSDGDLKTTLQN